MTKHRRDQSRLILIWELLTELNHLIKVTDSILKITDVLGQLSPPQEAVYLEEEEKPASSLLLFTKVRDELESTSDKTLRVISNVFSLLFFALSFFWLLVGWGLHLICVD